MATYESRLNVNVTGKPISGVLGVIYDAGENRVDADTTNKLGEYSFKNLNTGPHTIKWFGRGYTEADYMTVHIIDELDANELQDLTYTTTPTLSISETSDDNYTNSAGEQTSVAELTLSNLIPSTGNLRQIVVEWKRSDKNRFDNSTTLIYDTSLPNISSTGAVGTYDLSVIMYNTDSSSYDFKIKFLSDVSQPAKINGNVIEITGTASFNGVPDLQEMISVSGLAASNVSAMHGNNSMGSELINNDAQGILNTNTTPWSELSALGSELVPSNSPFVAWGSDNWDTLSESNGTHTFKSNGSGYSLAGIDLNFGSTLSAENKLFKVSFTINVISLDTGNIRVYLGSSSGGYTETSSTKWFGISDIGTPATYSVYMSKDYYQGFDHGLLEICTATDTTTAIGEWTLSNVSVKEVPLGVYGSDLITNGHFNTNTAGWNSYDSGTVSHETSTTFVGSGALRCTNDGTNRWMGMQVSEMSLAAGKIYKLSAKVWIPNTFTPNVHIRFIDGGTLANASDSFLYANSNVTDEWQTTETYIKTGSDTSGKFYIYAATNQPANGDYIIVDNVSFKEVIQTNLGANMISNSYFNTPTLGSELITNGGFTAWTGDDPDGWDVSTEYTATKITQNGNACRLLSDPNDPASSTGFIDIGQDILTAGKTYKVSINVTENNSAAGMDIRIQDDNVTSSFIIAGISTVGVHTAYFTSANGGDFRIIRDTSSPDGIDMTFTDVSVKEVLSGSILGWSGKEATLSYETVAPIQAPGSLKSTTLSSGNYASGGPYQDIGMTTLTAYKVSGKMRLVSGSSNGKVMVFSSLSNGTSQSLVYSDEVNTLTVNGSSVYFSFIFYNYNGNPSIQFACDVADGVFLLDDIWVAEVLDNPLVSIGSNNSFNFTNNGYWNSLRYFISGTGNKNYRISLKVSDYSSGTLKLYQDTNPDTLIPSANITADGDYSFSYSTVDSNFLIQLSTGDFIGTVSNISVREDLTTDNPSYVNTSSLNLVWDSINSFSSYPQDVVDATGVTHTLTEEQANRAGTYNIYMFIASEQDNPSSEFPGISSSEGTWHKVGETSDTNYEVNCPINSAVGFWVGFMDDSRQTSVTTTEAVY